MAGRTFGRFEIRGELGRGAYGVVLDAYDPTTDRTVALKLLHEREARDPENVERLRREAEALARLRHPNVVTIHEAGVRDGYHYVVLEHVAGRSLDGLWPELSLPRRLALIEEAARGLHAAHVAGVVHRDVKPANILVDDEGHARVIDFGLAAITGASLRISNSGAFVGTPAYAAPEQARTERAAIGPRTDVYALGAILFEALTGELVYQDARAITSFVSRLASDAPSPRPRDRAPHVAPELDAVCARALEKDPSKRFESAADFAGALRAASGAHGPSRRALLLLRGLLLLAVLLAVLGLAVALRAAVTTTSATTGTSGPAPPPLVAAPPSHPTPVLAPARPPGEGGPPLWFTLLRAADRPPLPLPSGVSFGARAGEYVSTRDGSVLVFVPPGESLMGSDEGDDRERPPHTVELSGYFVGKLEVTTAQFGAFVVSTKHVTTAEKRGSSIGLSEKGEGELARASWRDPDASGTAPPGELPASHVSWQDANAYAVWANLALPTEAQWEKAAAWDPATRRLRRYAWGDSAASAASPKVGNVLDETLRRILPKVACFDGYEDGFLAAAPVGSFPAGASPTGALDMTGNVAEWCADAYDETFYARSPRTDPVSTVGTQRVIRGGSFSYGPRSCRAARRGAADEERTSQNLGFRVALSGR